MATFLFACSYKPLPSDRPDLQNLWLLGAHLYLTEVFRDFVYRLAAALLAAAAYLHQAMSIQFDRNGVPLYDGDPALFKEYRERSWDLFHGRSGNPGLQGSTPIHLRQGLSGPAYDAVKEIAHDKLITKTGDDIPTEAGMKLLLTKLEASIQNLLPVRMNELFLNVLYGPQVWRGHGESMMAYSIRRDKEFAELKGVSQDTHVSDDIKASLLLRFSGLDAREQNNVLSSVGNKYDIGLIQNALRMLHPSIHERKQETKGPGSVVPSKGGGHGGNGQIRRQDWRRPTPRWGASSYLADDDGTESEAAGAYWQDGDWADVWPEADEAWPDVFWGDGDEEEGYSDDEDLDAYLAEWEDPSTMTPAEVEAFAAYAQTRRKGKGKGRGKGKGKGKFKGKSKGKSKGMKDSYGSSQTAPSRFPLQDGFTDRQKQQRKSNIAAIKAKTQCGACGQFGHWHGDPQCPSKGSSGGKGSSKGRTSSTYFVLQDDDLSAEQPLVVETFVATKAKDCDVICCEHCPEKAKTGKSVPAVTRGANGASRWLQCRQCDCRLVTANRQERSSLWAYLAVAAMNSSYGERSRHRERNVRMLAAEMERDRVRAEAEVRPMAQAPKAKVRPGRGWPRAAPEGLGAASSSAPPAMARISRKPQSEVIKIYGLVVDPLSTLRPFPMLAPQDMDLLDPLPSIIDTLDFGRFKGVNYAAMAADVSNDWYNCWCLEQVISCKEATCPGLFRYAYFLYSLASAAHRYAVGTFAKRSADEAQGLSPMEVEQARRSPELPLGINTFNSPVVVNVQFGDDPTAIQNQECTVMMADDSLDELSVYALDEDEPGLAVLDTACGKTMNGEEWRRDFEKELLSRGLMAITEEKSQTFRGVGGSTVSRQSVTWPVGIWGNNGEIVSAQVPGRVPMLISRQCMQNMGTKIDVQHGKVDFTAIGVFGLDLKYTKGGHPAVSLLDYDTQEKFADKFLVSDPTAFQNEETLEVFAHLLEQHREPEKSQVWEDAFHVMTNQEVVIDDEFAFDTFVAESRILPGGNRRLTSRRTKKLDFDESTMDTDDLRTNAVFSRTRRRATLPAGSKTWVKQLFAGQMGLSMLFLALGLAIGVPLDVHTGWDATTRAGRSRLHLEVQEEDPYCMVFTHPCGPWGNWSRFNLWKGGKAADTVLEARRLNRPILKLVNDTIVARCKRNRHVFCEHPAGSEGWVQPEMAGVRALIANGTLMVIKAHGCTMGYLDSTSGLPHKKPIEFVTSMVAAVEIFDGYLCPGNHAHEPLKGGNSNGPRTFQAATWPDQLDDLVSKTIFQQALIEDGLYVAESFPVLGPDNAAPLPVRHKRRRAFAPVPVLPGLPPGDDALPAIPEDTTWLPAGAWRVPVDPDGTRAEQVAGLELVLSSSEKARRGAWLQVPDDVRREIRRMHVNFGHPTNVGLARILRRRGAKALAINALDYFSCDSCGDAVRAKHPRPARLPGRYVFNYHIMLDTFTIHDCVGTPYFMMNIVCDGTCFQVVVCLGVASGIPLSRVCRHAFNLSWASWAGMPQSVATDRGKEWLMDFAQWMKDHGVEHETVALEAPWQLGRCEKQGGIWKEMWRRVCQDCSVQGLAAVESTAVIISQTKNELLRHEAHAPAAWVLGSHGLRVPGSLLRDDEAQLLEVQQGALDPASAMAANLGRRESARIAWIRMDNDGAARRAILRKSVPTRAHYPVGSYVYFGRKQHAPGDHPDITHRWYGPARVIGHETRNLQRTEEPVLTPGAGAHAVWLRYGPTTVLATNSQLRWASEDEMLAAHAVPSDFAVPPITRGARGYVDITFDELRPPAAAEPRLPGGPADAAGGAAAARAAAAPVSRETAAADSMQHQSAMPLRPQLPAQAEATAGPATPRRHQQGEINSPEPEPMQDTPLHDLRPPSALETAMRRGTLDALDGDRPGGPIRSSRRLERFTPFPGASSSSTAPASSARVPDDMDALAVDNHTIFMAVQYGNILRHDGLLDEIFEKAPRVWRQESFRPKGMAMPSASGPRWRHVTRRITRDLFSGQILQDLDVSEASDGTAQDGQLDTQGHVETFFLHDDSRCRADAEESMLVGRAARSEVNLRDLDPATRALYDDSMGKEWKSWQDFNAVEILTQGDIDALPTDTKIIGTRWVHTDKNAKSRSATRPLPVEAKSRLVVQGCQEEDLDGLIRSDSPTASLLAFNLVCSVSALRGWPITAADASTAYLQSKGISRILILKAPRPPPPGETATLLMRAKGSIYGTKDAGRSWWMLLRSTLLDQGWFESRFEAALFLLWDGPDLTGILISHVDDLKTGGVGLKYANSLKEMATIIKLTFKPFSFKYCGKNVRQLDDFSIEVDQTEAILALEYLPVQKDRRTKPNTPLNAAELTLLRSGVGATGWIIRQTRYDQAVEVSMIAQNVGKPTIRDLVDCNKVIKALKDTAQLKLLFSAATPALNWDNMEIFAGMDASFGNIDDALLGAKTKSQAGYVVGFASPGLAAGDMDGRVHVLEAMSHAIKRVCRSTLAAESNGFLEGAEAAEYLRAVCIELVVPNPSFTDIDLMTTGLFTTLYTDAMSLASTLAKDCGRPEDKRVRILVAQIRELLTPSAADAATAFVRPTVRAEWIDTAVMIADGLTKLGAPKGLLIKAMTEGCWSIVADKFALDAKERVRAGRHARAEARRLDS